MNDSIIDSHQHFWKFDPQRDNWITDEMIILRKDYLPADIVPVFKQNHIKGSILVQADPSENENRFLLSLAVQHSFIEGVVGWINFNAERLEERLADYLQYGKLKGFRHLLQGECQRDGMLNPGFQKGIGLLSKYGFSYDLLILPDQLGYAEKLVAGFPEQRFVIDHLAKPQIKKGNYSEWKLAMQAFAPHQNVFCKISGMVSEADRENWKAEDFRPYLDTVVDVFGIKRIMFGSDWPVCLLAATYQEVKEIVNDYFKSFSDAEQADFFSGNARTFYRLS